MCLPVTTPCRQPISFICYPILLVLLWRFSISDQDWMRATSRKYFSFLEYFFTEINFPFFFLRNYSCQLTSSLISYKNFFKFLRISTIFLLDLGNVPTLWYFIVVRFIKNDCNSFLLPDFISSLITDISRAMIWHSFLYTFSNSWIMASEI